MNKIKEIGELYGVKLFLDPELKHHWTFYTDGQIKVLNEFRLLRARLTEQNVKLVGVVLGDL